MFASFWFSFDIDLTRYHRPIDKAWDKKVPGHCIQLGALWYSTSVLAIVTDLAIIILPVKEILKLKLPQTQKIGLALLFSLGTL